MSEKLKLASVRVGDSAVRLSELELRFANIIVNMTQTRGLIIGPTHAAIFCAKEVDILMQDIDDRLSLIESIAHGEIGEMITKLRSELVLQQVNGRFVHRHE